MTQSTSKIRCADCQREYDRSELVDDSCCPNCENELLHYAGPSRGCAAEILAEERAEAETEEERDVYRALLHLLACNLLTKHDISAFIHWGNTTENLNYVLGEALEEAEETDEGEILVCPNCGNWIKSWARWFYADYANSIHPNRAIR